MLKNLLVYGVMAFFLALFGLLLVAWVELILFKTPPPPATGTATRSVIAI